jgi:hypothetical protein
MKIGIYPTIFGQSENRITIKLREASMCACGLDIGTCFLVSAKQDTNGEMKLKSIRNSFLDLDNDSAVKNMLKLSKTDFIEAGDKIYIVGDAAMVLATLFNNREARRPLSRGVLSPGELEAEKVLMVLIESILGKSQSAIPEVCFYSVPAPAVDMEMDVIYHGAMLSKLISQLGYKPVSLNEAAAIAYSNAAPENFSALTISHGSGMLNFCLMYQTIIGMSFSLARGGDWLDISAARAVGSTAARIQSIKEKGIDLMDPSKGEDFKTLREREALIVYYKSLILYELEMIKREFTKRQGTINLPSAVPIILSGGTALAVNFLDFFKSAFNTIKDTFPFAISEIRMASSPLNAVAQGLLVAALNYDEGSKK